MIHTHTFNNLTVQTGDILCTRDGTDHNWFGRLWHMIGYLVPGHIDHAILYVGPGGRCIEAGGKGVIEFDMPGTSWDSPKVAAKRLLHALAMTIERHEQAFGPLEIDVQKRITPGFRG